MLINFIVSLNSPEDIILAESEPTSLNVVDPIMNEVFSGICQLVIQSTAEAAEKILFISSEFLSEDAAAAVEKFQNLYLGGSSELEQSKESANKEVDDLIDKIQTSLDSGADLNSSVVEDDASKKSRLSLAGVQKELETIITMEVGIKEKLLPVLSGMQFEDIIKQRVNHISECLTIAIEGIKNGTDTNQIEDQIRQILSSNGELTLYYKHVLRQDPPVFEKPESSILFDLIA